MGKNSKGKKRRRFHDTRPLVTEPHERPYVDVTSANAGATPVIGCGVVLAVAHRFADEDYEPFAYVRLTQEFIDRLYRLARLAHEECLEHLEIEHRIEWNVDMFRRQPQHLRIARTHFYWTGSSPHSWAEANTAPVLFSELEEKLAPNDSAAMKVIFIGIEDPDDQADILDAVRPRLPPIPSGEASTATQQIARPRRDGVTGTQHE